MAGNDLVKVESSTVAAITASRIGPSHATRAALLADLAWPDGASGVVYGDATAAFNGTYRKSGGNNSGSWTRIGDVPMTALSQAMLDQKADRLGVAASTAPAGVVSGSILRSGTTLVTGWAGAYITLESGIAILADRSGIVLGRGEALTVDLSGVAPLAVTRTAMNSTLRNQIQAGGAKRLILYNHADGLSGDLAAPLLALTAARKEIFGLHTGSIEAEGATYRVNWTGAKLTQIESTRDIADVTDLILARGEALTINMNGAVPFAVTKLALDAAARKAALETGETRILLYNSSDTLSGPLAEQLMSISSAQRADLDLKLDRAANLADIADPGQARSTLGAASFEIAALATTDLPRLRGELVRAEFATGLLRFPGSDGDITQPLRDVADLSTAEQGLMVVTGGGTIARTVPGRFRRLIGVRGVDGYLVEAAGTAWAPDAEVGGAGYGVTGVAVTEIDDDSAVDGEMWQRISSLVTGRTARNISLGGVNTVAGKWYQLDLVIRPQMAKQFIVRFPGGFSSGSHTTLDVKIDTYLATAEVRSAAVSVVPVRDPILIRRLQDGYHVRVRMQCVTAQANQLFHIYPRTEGALVSTYAAGDDLFDIALMSVTESAEPRMPAHGLGTAVALPAESMTIPVDARIGTETTIDMAFALSAMSRPGSATRQIIKLSRGVDDDSGIAVQLMGDVVRVIVAIGNIERAIDTPAPFDDSYRVALSYDGETLSVGVNGVTTSVPYSRASFFRHVRMIHVGTGLQLGQTTPTGFAGVVSHVRLASEALSAGELRALTSTGRRPYSGEQEPVVLDASGRAVLSLDGFGRIEARAGKKMTDDILSAAQYASVLPADAIGVTPKPDGLHYLTDGHGGRTHRIVHLPAGIDIGYRNDGEIDLLWANGQSLAYGAVYANPVNWTDTPYFRDVDDGLGNSVFGYSVTGYAGVGLKQPYIGDGIVAHGGGVAYTACNSLARLRARDEPSPRVIIGKTIGQSGNLIKRLWPSGIYTEDPYNGPGGAFNPDTPLFNATVFPDTHWRNVRRWYGSVRDTATALGLTVRMPAMVWVHGTADANASTAYAAAMDNARVDLDKLNAEFFRLDARPLWVMTQSGGRADTATARWPVCQAQVGYCETRKGAVLATPLYAPEYVLADDNVHPDYASTTLFGELIAHAIHETLAGNRWTIGQPELSRDGGDLILDYDRWLRPGEKLTIAPDTYYGGDGIDAGCGVDLFPVVDPDTDKPARYGPKVAVSGIALAPGGRAYRVTPSAPVPGLVSVWYAFQEQTPADLSRYAHRGLLRTDWQRPSARLADRMLYRWLPSFKKEIPA